MAIRGIYANIGCRDLERSEDWYRLLFGRPPDARPMDGLAEWHFGAHGFQLHCAPGRAGHCVLTVMVDGLLQERARLARLSPGEVEAATAVSIVRLEDPDRNLVVLAGER